MVTAVSENNVVLKSHVHKEINNHFKFIKMNILGDFVSL